MTQTIENPCVPCGGVVPNRCFSGFFGVEEPNQRLPVMVIIKDHHKADARFNITQVIAQLAHELDTERWYWTTPTKCCGPKNFITAFKHCQFYLNQEIQHIQPKVVITVGADVLELVYGDKRKVESIGEVTPRTAENGFKYHHLHIASWDELATFPERGWFQKQALQKIEWILAGAYANPTELRGTYHHINQQAQLDWFFDLYKDNNVYPWVSLDIETGGKDDYGAVGLDAFNPHNFIIGVSLCCKIGHAVFVDLTEIENPKLAMQKIYDFCAHKGKVNGQNLVFDFNAIREKYGHDLWPYFYFDTMLADHLLREWDKQHGLKRLASLFLGPAFENYEQPLEDYFEKNKIKSDDRDYADLPRPLLSEYAAMDTDVVERLLAIFWPKLEKANLLGFYFSHVVKMQRAYGDDMNAGWGVDAEYYKQLKAEVTAERNAALEALSKSPIWAQYIVQKDADFRKQGKVFWDEGTEKLYTDYQCLKEISQEEAIANGWVHGYKKDGSAGKNTGKPLKDAIYTHAHIIPKPTNDNWKREVLFHHNFLNLQAPNHTKKGLPQVDQISMIRLKQRYGKDTTVKNLLENFEIIDRTEKQLSTYIDAAHDRVDDKGEFKRGWLRADGLAHPSYLLSSAEDDDTSGGTKTGRISCKFPNQTNIPTRRKGKKVKKMYIPVPRRADGSIYWTDPEEWYIGQLDYSQVELRVLGDRSGDPFIINAYLNKKDLHTELAAQRFERSVEWFVERLTDEKHPEHSLAFDWRRCAKTFWFAFIYGAGANKLSETLLKEDIDISAKELQKHIDGLRRDLPYVERLRQQVYAARPEIYTPFGRRRVAWNSMSNDSGIAAGALRQLFNFLIQGTATDIASMGVYNSCEWLRHQRKEFGMRSYVMGAVHDSFVVAIPKSELDYVIWNVKQIMENPPLPWQFRVPLKVDAEFGKNWGSLQGWSYQAA